MTLNIRQGFLILRQYTSTLSHVNCTSDSVSPSKTIEEAELYRLKPVNVMVNGRFNGKVQQQWRGTEDFFFCSALTTLFVDLRTQRMSKRLHKQKVLNVKKNGQII